jgi:hypothetical protein
VPLVVFGALFAGRFGEQEGAPVADATDDAAGGKDDVAGCARDSGLELVSWVAVWVVGKCTL